jgi:hypothetical protein
MLSANRILSMSDSAAHPRFVFCRLGQMLVMGNLDFRRRFRPGLTGEIRLAC